MPIQSPMFCGCSSVVEHHVANVRVVSSNLITRYLSINKDLFMEHAAPQASEFSDDNVQVIVHRRPGSRIEYEVKAKPGLVQEAHRNAIKAVAKRVSLPGFRKGRAPDQLIIRNYPQDLDKHWQEMIANAAFRASDNLAKQPVLQKDTKITFKMKSHSLEQGAELSLTFETEPLVPTVDPKQFQIKAPVRPEVSDAKVDETIRQVQLFFAEWKVIEGRPAQEGDFVLLDIENLEDNPPSKIFSGTRFEVTDKSMAQWMKALVVGMKAGESAEGVSRPDTTATDAEKEEYKPKKVRLTLKLIEQPVAPPIDEEFAKKLGVQTLEEMRHAITNILNKQADGHVQEEMRTKASEFLLTHYPFEMPQTLIEKETHFRMQQLMHDAQFQQYWNSMNEEERKKTVQSLYEQSEKAVRMFYLCRKLVQDANVSISSEDLPKYPSSTLEMLLQPHNEWKSNQAPEVRQAEAYSRIILEKAEDFLIAHANKE
jgi:trigger factor